MTFAKVVGDKARKVGLDQITEIDENEVIAIDFPITEKEEERVYIWDVGMDASMKTILDISGKGFDPSGDEEAMKTVSLYLMKRNAELSRAHWVLEQFSDGSLVFNVKAFMLMETMDAEDLRLNVKCVATEYREMRKAVSEGRVVL